MADAERPFTPRRDHHHAPGWPIHWNVDSAVDTEVTDTSANDLHLLRDCLALGKPEDRRPPAKVRLEEALGPELARKLLCSLSETKRP